MLGTEANLNDQGKLVIPADLCDKVVPEVVVLPAQLAPTSMLPDPMPARRNSSGRIPQDVQRRSPPVDRCLAAVCRALAISSGMALVNVDSYTWYGGSEANLEEMAANIARVINSKPGTIVSQPSPVTLITY